VASDHAVETLRGERKLKLDDYAVIGQVHVAQDACHPRQRVLPRSHLGLAGAVAESFEEALLEFLGDHVPGRVGDELDAGSTVEMHLGAIPLARPLPSRSAVFRSLAWLVERRLLTVGWTMLSRLPAGWVPAG
jgi:hypothetical protein